ncbi:hypothetical protein T492DRAFT_935507 [Pavlovales sp. CCMP2436]|nr:hypothetical protein T492DRAFT_935507 [Pavlovales sp. CCMP2436]|mmetsp:Transcript_25795/g.65437  ORF Transcript_25795/g.65437 Transcript_25795/m.65437 type:complete len:163 (+) Transcript_25795:129-617(+)
MSGWGDMDVEWSEQGPDTTPPLAAYACAPSGMSPASAFGKRGRELQHGATEGGDSDEGMHERIKRLNIGREGAPPRLVWHGDAQLVQLAAAPAALAGPVDEASRARLERLPSFDAQSEREMLDCTYTCMNRLLGRLHEERKVRRRSHMDDNGLDESDDDDDL